MFQFVVEFVLATAMLIIFITQIFIPTIKGTKLFPFLRSDISQASDKIVEAGQKAEVKELEQRAKEISAATNKTNTSKKG